MVSAPLLLPLLAAAAFLLTHVHAQATPECHQCYTLVERAVQEHRERLAQLDGLLRTVGSDVSAGEERELQRHISIIRANIRDLSADARRAVLRGSSPLLLLGDLQERIEEVRKSAGSLLVYLEQARPLAGQCERTISEAERLLARLQASLRAALAFLTGAGQEALLRAIEQSKQFGLQSARMSEIAREARRRAERHELDAKALVALSATAESNATAAYKLANTLFEQQTNYSSEISLLTTGLSSSELLVSEIRLLAQQAQSDATEAYEAALSLYTEARAGFGSIDVDGLKRRADYVKADAQRLKTELEELTSRHGPLLDGLQRDISSLKVMMERGLSQQMSADQLMVDVSAARDKARQAVAAGDRTLDEAQKTLETLLGFDRQVQESRERAQAALSRVRHILTMVERAESRTGQAGRALQGADRDAAAASDAATEAQALAGEAYQEVTSIQSQAAATSQWATAIRLQANETSVKITQIIVTIEQYQQQAASDSALARQALEKAGLAAGSAGEAEARVLAALKLLQEMLARLSAAGSLDLVTLAELEQRLAAAEAQLEAADMLTKLDDFRRHRTQHEKLVTDYEKELAFLRGEVLNVREMADVLPTGCYNRITLEP